MNEEIYDKRALIKQEINNIKISTLQTQLLSQFNHESNLDNFLSSLPKQVVINSLQRFEKKLKGYQQIEKDLPDNLIPNEESYVILPKLNTLRLKLAILYAERLGNENIEEKNSYNEIKLFTFKILKLINFNLKLKCFDLSIKLLHKTIEDPNFNKEFIGVFDLLKLFVNERNYLPSEEDLQYISNLGSDANEEDIKKCFYGIIRELNKKIIFKNLLNKILEIIKNQNNSPLMQFNIIFITKCLNNVSSLDANDLNQIVGLVYRALEHYNELIIMKKVSHFFNKMFSQKNLKDYLMEFEADFKEKTSGQIINYPERHDFSSNEKNTVENTTQELDLSIYFPIHINNEKIRVKFAESQQCFNGTLVKNINTNEHLAFNNFREELAIISNKAYEIIENAKAIASDAKENLVEFAETSADRLTNFLKKKSETSLEKNAQTDIDLNVSLNEAKAKLLPIREKLTAWNSILITNVGENYHNPRNQIDTSEFDLNQCLELVNSFTFSLNEKFNGFIQQILDEFEKINNALQKDSWFAKPEIDKSSFFHQIFLRGYFSGKYTIEKMKDYLKNDLSFATVNNLISKQSFWGLLSFGIIRWPWINKIIFAQNWAEQFRLTDVIKEIEKIKNTLAGRDEEKILKEIISISSELLPSQSEISDILDNFKRKIVKDLKQLETLEQKIDNGLNEKENSLFSLNSKPLEFFRCDKNCGFSSPDDLMNGNTLGLTLKVH